jgi:hypothetical protein
MLQTPKLADTRFDFLAVRFGFDLDTVSERVAEYFLTDGVAPSELVCFEAQNNQLIECQSSCEEGAQGLINLSLERFKTFQLPETNASLEDISGCLANVMDEIATWAYASAEFSIPHDMLPRDGLIARMLGLRATIGEGDFVLTGAKLTSRSEPSESVSCSLDLLGADGVDKVSGVVNFDFHGPADFHCLINALAAAEDRLNRIVLESPLSVAHDSH